MHDVHFNMSDNKLLCVLNNNNLILNSLQDELEENELLFSYLMPNLLDLPIFCALVAGRGDKFICRALQSRVGHQ